MQHQDNAVVPLTTNTVTGYNETPSKNDVDMENPHMTDSLEYIEPCVPVADDPIQTPTTSLQSARLIELTPVPTQNNDGFPEGPANMSTGVDGDEFPHQTGISEYIEEDTPIEVEPMQIQPTSSVPVFDHSTPSTTQLVTFEPSAMSATLQLVLTYKIPNDGSANGPWTISNGVLHPPSGVVLESITNPREFDISNYQPQIIHQNNYQEEEDQEERVQEDIPLAAEPEIVPERITYNQFDSRSPVMAEKEVLDIIFKLGDCHKEKDVPLESKLSYGSRSSTVSLVNSN